MKQTFINLRFDEIEKRFSEIDLLLKLAVEYESDFEIYKSLCRSANVLLVSHFEGLYKDISRDILDDLNANTHFYEVPKNIFNTHCQYYIHGVESQKSLDKVKQKLWTAFKDYPSKLHSEPFLYVDNKNPAPKIIESILERFGVKNFFWNLESSDLDIVFQNQKTKSIKLRNRLLKNLKNGTAFYPYAVTTSTYNPVEKLNIKKGTTLWEDFINNFLRDRHNIIHGNTMNNPNDHESLSDAKLKIEIILYAFILNICVAANPMMLLQESN